jgi:tetratricopeptide (TPR) repeat protein
LETIRQYAHEKLVDAGLAEMARARHLQYYLELAEKVERKIRGPDIACILERLEAELDNLRLALAWSLEGRGRPGWDPVPGLRLASALKWFWHCRGRQDEGIHWLEMLLAGELEERGMRPLSSERTRCRAKGLEVAAWSAGLIDETTKANKFAAESCELYQSLGAEGRVGYAYARLAGWISMSTPIRSIRLLDECQVIFQEADDRQGLGECIVLRGHNAQNYKDYDKAKTYYEENLALREEIGDLDGVAGSFWFLSSVAFHQGMIDHGRALAEQSLELFSKIHNDSYQAYVYIQLNMYDMLAGNYARAESHANKALSIGRRQGDVTIIHQGLLNLGELGLLQGHILEAINRLEECLAYFRKTDYKVYIADSLYYLGLLAWTTDDLEQALGRYTEALVNYRAGGRIYHEARVLCELGKVALARGEIDQAQVLFDQAIKKNIVTPFPYWENREPVMLTLEATAALAAAQGLLGRATRLLGATEAWHIRFFHSRTPRERQEREGWIATLRSALGEKTFTTAWQEGQAMTLDQAILYVQNMA